MSSESANGAVGYKRPPKETQWKKGQCGNPKRQYKRRKRSIIETIDALFENQVEIVENGQTRRISSFEAIVLQLWSKVMSGDRKAANVFMMYLKFANSGGCDKEEFIFEFPQNDYTRKLSGEMEDTDEELPDVF